MGDWWRGDMSSRRLVLLVRQLPEDSATKRAMSDDPWPATLHMLVSLFNEIRLYRTDFAAAYGEKAKLPLMPHPGEMARVEEQEQANSVHDALLSMMQPPQDPDLVDARTRLAREAPEPPRTETY